MNTQDFCFRKASHEEPRFGKAVAARAGEVGAEGAARVLERPGDVNIALEESEDGVTWREVESQVPTEEGVRSQQAKEVPAFATN